MYSFKLQWEAGRKGLLKFNTYGRNWTRLTELTTGKQNTSKALTLEEKGKLGKMTMFDKEIIYLIYVSRKNTEDIVIDKWETSLIRKTRQTKL